MNKIYKLSSLVTGFFLILFLIGCEEGNDGYAGTRPSEPANSEPIPTETMPPLPTLTLEPTALPPTPSPLPPVGSESTLLPFSISCHLPNNQATLDDDQQPHFTIFQEGKSISSGSGYKGTYPIDLQAGQYDVLIRYGQPPTDYLVNNLEVAPNQSTYSVQLPYSSVKIMPQTVSGFTPNRPYGEFTLTPRNYPAPYERTRTLNTNDLWLPAGNYELAATWQMPDGEPATGVKAFEVTAGEPLSVTLDFFPDDGQLLIETSSSNDTHMANLTVLDANGVSAGSNPYRTLSPNNLSMNVLYTGAYTVTVTFSSPLTTTHTFTATVKPATVTIIQIGDEETAVPVISYETQQD